MDTHDPERTGLNLPPPVGEQLPPAAGQSETQKQSPEAAPIASETGRAETAAAAPAVPTLPLPPVPQGGAPVSTSDVSNTTNVGTTTAAADDDLIEKEWVNKAKAIVERTRDDPYVQSRELTGVKADYMKQRYNKTIKLSE